MILELRLENVALIERASVRLGAGLNALSGETGAGKSIIVGALSLLLGERASSSVVRPGAERAMVEGVFDVTGRPGVAAILEEQGIGSEDGLLILRREVAAEGRNRAWVNGSAATAAVVGRLGGLLVDLHGQHEHQSLLRPADQREILDAFGGAAPAAAAVREAFALREGLRERVASLDRERERAAARAADLTARAEDIEAAQPVPGEDAELESEGRLLEHAEELALLAASAHDALYAADDSILARLDEQRRTLARLLAFDPGREEDARTLEGAYFELQELGRRLGDYASRLEHDPGRLEQIRARKDQLFRLRRRYGAETSDDLVRVAEDARRELDEIAGYEAERRDAAQALQRAESDLGEAAAELSSRRREAARALEERLSEALPALDLPGRFEVRLAPREEPGRHGAEAVELLFAPNPGFDPLPLARIASGGELSRVMLALKTVLAEVDRVPSLVFDEIDAGVGGEIAMRVAAALREVAERHQVLVVTHLPQIAARAAHHVRVEKEVREGTTITRVRALEAEARVEELARMLGSPDGETSRRHAAALLAGGAAVSDPPAP